MLQFLQDQRRRSFTDDQTVAIAIEWARGRRWFVVANAGGVEHVEDRRLRRAQLLGAAGDHHILHPEADRFVGVADPLAAGGAGAGGRNNPTCYSEE
jgi:hypothetical protein